MTTTSSANGVDSDSLAGLSTLSISTLHATTNASGDSLDVVIEDSSNLSDQLHLECPLSLSDWLGGTNLSLPQQPTPSMQSSFRGLEPNESGMACHRDKGSDVKDNGDNLGQDYLARNGWDGDGNFASYDQSKPGITSLSSIVKWKRIRRNHSRRKPAVDDMMRRGAAKKPGPAMWDIEEERCDDLSRSVQSASESAAALRIDQESSLGDWETVLCKRGNVSSTGNGDTWCVQKDNGLEDEVYLAHGRITEDIETIYLSFGGFRPLVLFCSGDAGCANKQHNPMKSPTVALGVDLYLSWKIPTQIPVEAVPLSRGCLLKTILPSGKILARDKYRTQLLDELNNSPKAIFRQESKLRKCPSKNACLVLNEIPPSLKTARWNRAGLGK
ncbi:hypothetical protein GQ53DRAFT_841499 [Thozetella sp. PMI_491]|nr:hypothetical protein GQ53DRAFT_841499 [Thozetella sp. PMI_491]